MKKKLLSLVLAGAMVASTSVSAFAATPNIIGPDNKEHEAQIKLTGDVEDQRGQVQPGTISVSIPTTSSFRVNSEGKFVGTTIKVENSGAEKVDVFAKGFTDVTPEGSITVVAEGNVNNRGDVSLKLRGTSGIAYFGSDVGEQGTGVYSDPTLDTSVDEQKLASVSSGGEETLFLEGTSTKGADANNAIRDDFTIVLKVAKSK
mgnify:CR=1 FL=1